MTGTAIDWVTSFAAMQTLREAGVADPVGTMTRLAELQQLRSCAARGRFDGTDIKDPFPEEPKTNPVSGETVAPPLYVPAEFWRSLNAGNADTEIYGEAGVFATTVIHDPEIGNYSETEHIKLFGVTFHAGDLAAFLETGGKSFPNPKQGKERKPSVKKGRPPSDDRILAKADEMHAQGLGSRDIARDISKMPGFENVGTVAARALIDGRYPRGRRTKTKV
jgi:hypothetical protein